MGVPEGWRVVPVLSALNKVGRVRTLPRSDYALVGRYPVIDQGKSQIGGYTNCDDLLYSGPVPVIMFGDHTREWKFLDFPFVAGADGTQLLTVASDAEPRFIYYAATNLDIPNLGYSRHFKELRELSLLLPPLPEQRKIAAILSSVDEAIEKTQAVIDQVQVVKKGLMQELLTKGLPGRHQKFKQTEIGTIPESWDVIRFGEAFRRVRNPVDVQPATLYREIGIRSHAKGIFHKEPVTGATLGNKQVFWIVPGALIINIVFAWERAVAVTSEGENGMICSHRFPMYVPDSSMDVKFAALYFQESAGAAMLEAISPGGAGRNRTLNQSKLVELPCPRPSLAEQMQIAETVVAIEQRLVADHRAISQLRTLKSALMQTLLTGQLRVTP